METRDESTRGFVCLYRAQHNLQNAVLFEEHFGKDYALHFHLAYKNVLIVFRMDWSTNDIN